MTGWTSSPSFLLMETCDGGLIWCGGVLSGRVRSVLVWKKSITFVFDHLDALNSDFPMY